MDFALPVSPPLRISWQRVAYQAIPIQSWRFALGRILLNRPPATNSVPPRGRAFRLLLLEMEMSK